MIRIKSYLGNWKAAKNITLLQERCYDPKCMSHKLDGVLVYPIYFRNPNCPDCEKDLYGNKLIKDQESRIQFHIEGKVDLYE